MSAPAIRLDYTPHPAQAQVHAAIPLHRFVVIAAGRRFGKSHLALAESLRTALERPGASVLVVSPVYAQARARFREFLALLRGLDARLVASALKNELRIEFANRSAVTFASAYEPDRLRGEGFDLAVLDECGYLTHDLYDEVIRPALADRQGRLLAIGTPKGQRQLLYRLWMRGESGDAGWASFRFPTWANPRIPDSEREDVESAYPADVLQQEFFAEFLAESAGVFRNIAACIRGVLRGPEFGRRYVLGADLAKKSDFTVLTVLDLATRQLVAFERFNSTDYLTQARRIVELARTYSGASILIDQTGVGEAVLDYIRGILATSSQGAELHRRGGMVGSAPRVSGLTLTNETKQDLIDRLRLDIERGRVGIPEECSVLLRELEVFTYEMLPSGRVRYAAPSGFHDDAVISLALANFAAPTEAASLEHVDGRLRFLIEQLSPLVRKLSRFGLPRRRSWSLFDWSTVGKPSDLHAEFRLMQVCRRAGLLTDSDADLLAEDIRRRAYGTDFERVSYSDALDVEFGTWQAFIRGEAA